MIKKICLSIIISVSLISNLLAFGPMKSIEECLQSVKSNPSNDKAYAELGDAYLREKIYDKAADAYNKAISLNPKNASAYYGLSEVYRKQENYKNALDMASIASSLLPLKSRYKGQVGLIYYKMDKIDEAIETFKTAIALSTKKKGFYYSMLGNCYIKKGHYDKAVDMFKKVLEEKPWDKRIYADIARAYYKAGNKKKGDEYRSLAGDQWRADGGDTGKNYPISKGWIPYKTGNYDEAIKIFTDDINKDAKNPDAYLGLVYTYNKKGDLKKALEYANKAVSVAPDYSRTYSARGFIEEKSDKIVDAINDYKKAIELEQTDDFSREKLAKILYNKQEYKESAEHFKALLDNDNSNIYYMKMLGELYIKLHNYKDAMEVLKSALKIAVSPNDKKYIKREYAYAGYKYGDELEKAGDKQKSKSIFKEVSEVAPDTKYGEMAKGRIKE